MKLETVQRKLEAQLDKYFKSEGYADSEIEDSNLYEIKIEPNTHKKYTDIYIFSEISVDDFFTVQNSWNKIVESVDPSAYFDILNSGTYVARIYWDTAQKNITEDADHILDQSNLIKFGELLAADLDDEYDEDFWVDDIRFDKKRQKLIIEVSSQTYESKASIRVYEYDLDSYQDLIDIYHRKAIRALESHLVEI